MKIEHPEKFQFAREIDKNYYKEEAKKFYSVGIEGLTNEERDKFWRVYHMEFNRLNDDFDYMCKVLHFDTEKKLFKDNYGKWFDELKEFYRRSKYYKTEIV